ncbi:anhydro-N-acetylmuramic acid kinase [Sandaracinobacteroides hominis]|uniref:anhydro-N-acetylmuramic acid kinase n=1 Tax=Sandaracinobacteroides hominis TaxID=2780086 RepID=UPI0018F5775D|nr:anhydro-N-acetylmuramic acid kinase [Sandaracinobacteroides hominis]
MPSEKQIVIGLMSGTSVDAVDAALIETDGETHIRPIAFTDRPYTDAERSLIREAAALALTFERPTAHPRIAEAERLLTEAHAEAIAALPGQETATLIGFHGQTVAHRPPSSRHPHPFTWQIGDAKLLARRTGRPVVHDFRSADVAAGGEGAPLAPGYHRALASGLEWPVGVLNIGGVGNLTWFADGQWGGFDTGPGNGLIDDWLTTHTGQRYDAGGALAASGEVHHEIVAAMADLAFFDAEGPKSLDRADFTIQPARGLSPADGAATLTAFTAETIALALRNLPVRLNSLLVTGGGRHNPTLMRMIAERTNTPTVAVESHGWNGDALEAEAFAWLAVRSARGLPLSWPETTGVPAPATGGRLVRP